MKKRKKALNEMYAVLNDSNRWNKHKDLLNEVLNQHKPPTFDEVIKVWEDTIDDKLEFKNNDEGIRIIYPNGIYYLINREQVYSNRKVFSMNVNATLYAINLTVEYLKKRQINESGKATK